MVSIKVFKSWKETASQTAPCDIDMNARNSYPKCLKKISSVFRPTSRFFNDHSKEENPKSSLFCSNCSRKLKGLVEEAVEDVNIVRIKRLIDCIITEKLSEEYSSLIEERINSRISGITRELRFGHSSRSKITDFRDGSAARRCANLYRNDASICSSYNASSILNPWYSTLLGDSCAEIYRSDEPADEQNHAESPFCMCREQAKILSKSRDLADSLSGSLKVARDSELNSRRTVSDGEFYKRVASSNTLRQLNFSLSNIIDQECNDDRNSYDDNGSSNTLYTKINSSEFGTPDNKLQKTSSKPINTLQMHILKKIGDALPTKTTPDYRFNSDPLLSVLSLYNSEKIGKDKCAQINHASKPVKTLRSCYALKV